MPRKLHIHPRVHPHLFSLWSQFHDDATDAHLVAKVEGQWVKWELRGSFHKDLPPFSVVRPYDPYLEPPTASTQPSISSYLPNHSFCFNCSVTKRHFFGVYAYLSSFPHHTGRLRSALVFPFRHQPSRWGGVWLSAAVHGHGTSSQSRHNDWAYCDHVSAPHLNNHTCTAGVL